MKNEIIILSNGEEVSMADEWYDFANEDHFWIYSRFKAILNSLNQDSFKGKSTLEIGCGNAVVINQIEEHTKQSIDGCDLNVFALEKAKKINGNLYCLNIYDRPDLLIGKYDCILLLDVLEHLEDDLNFLETSLEYLKDNGIVIINVPALDFLFSRYDEIAGHKRRYNTKLIKKLLLNANLEIQYTGYWGAVLFPVASIRKVVLKFVRKEKIIETGFKPPHRVINSIFKFLLDLELKISGLTPFGTSIIAIGRKK